MHSQQNPFDNTHENSNVNSDFIKSHRAILYWVHSYSTDNSNRKMYLLLSWRITNVIAKTYILYLLQM